MCLTFFQSYSCEDTQRSDQLPLIQTQLSKVGAAASSQTGWNPSVKVHFFWLFFSWGAEKKQPRLSKLSICNCEGAVNVEESVSACYRSPHPPAVNALGTVKHTGAAWKQRLMLCCFVCNPNPRVCRTECRKEESDRKFSSPFFAAFFPLLLKINHAHGFERTIKLQLNPPNEIRPLIVRFLDSNVWETFFRSFFEFLLAHLVS